MAMQIRHVLRTVAWPGGAADVVFGTRGVFVFAGFPTEEQIPAGFPWALVSIDGGTPDEDHPEFLEQNYTIIVGAEVAGDPLGEFSIVGSSVADLGKSVGRGVSEIAERVRSAVENLTGADGAKVLLSSTSTGTPAAFGRGRHLTLHELSLTALCTSRLHYAAPQVARMPGAGTNTWEGTHVTDRFDFLQFNVIELTGTTPSADPTDGTSVLTTTALSDAGDPFTPVIGRTYTVFAQYNARDGSTVDGSSDPEVGSYVVVTSG